MVLAGCALEVGGEEEVVVSENAIGGCDPVQVDWSPSGSTVSGLVTLMATPPSCNPDAELRYRYKADGGPALINLLPVWTTSPTMPWDTTGLPPGKYFVTVNARAPGTTAILSSHTRAIFIGDVCSSVTLTSAPTGKRPIGTTFTLTAAALCGNPQYQFHHQAPGSSDWNDLGLDADGVFEWNSGSQPSGVHKLRVQVRNGSNPTVEATKMVNVTLGGTCGSLTLAADPAASQSVGLPVGLTATSSCPGSEARYQYSYRPTASATWEVFAPWTDEDQPTWDTTGLAAGPYQLRVEVRAVDATAAQQTKTLSYTLGGLCQSVTLATSPASPRDLGTAVTMTATANCGGATAQYLFSMREPGASTDTMLSEGWVSGSSFVLGDETTISGVHTLKVEVRALGASTTQATATRVYQFGSVCNNVAFSSVGGPSQPQGALVPLQASASCRGGASAQYILEYRPGTTGPWLPLQDWTTEALTMWGTGALAQGSYQVRVQAKAQGNVGTYESTRTITFTVTEPCPTNYEPNGVGGCVDTDECTAGTHACYEPGFCVNTEGSYYCDCPSGYSPDGAGGCWEIDECSYGTHLCNGLATCSNTAGSYDCLCPTGYEQDGAGGCVDTDECSTGANHCYGDATCTNTEGSYECTCPSGYDPDGWGGCSEVDECIVGHTCSDPATCSNTAGSYECLCPTGYEQDGSGGCFDTDECTAGTHSCGGTTVCENTEGSYDCVCPEGYEPDGWGDCTDTDECAGDHGCTDPLICKNTAGSYECVCPQGTFDEYGDGSVCSPEIDQLSAGGYHTCAIGVDGRLFCWGANWFGALGTGDGIDHWTPTQVGGDSDWDSVAGGDYHTCAIRGGSLYCWGMNWWYQLGTGDGSDQYSPVQIASDSDSDWVSVATGMDITCGLRGTGSLYCWGYVAGYGYSAVPLQIGSDSDWDSLTAGGSHACGIRGGNLYCWGANSYGQLGDGTTDTQPSPIQIGGDGGGWSSVTAGYLHTCGIRNGMMYCWGRGGAGQLGNGEGFDQWSPVQVGSDADWTNVDAGDSHTCGTRGGSLYCWGLNDHGQVGVGTSNTFYYSPEQVSGSGWNGVSLGVYFSCGTHDGIWYCWGDNPYGQFGDGTNTSTNAPPSVGITLVSPPA